MLQSPSAITGTFVPASDQVGPIRDSPALLRCSVGACRPRVKHAAEVRCSVSAAPVGQDAISVPVQEQGWDVDLGQVAAEVRQPGVYAGQSGMR
jgi:hypothetical protein